MKRPLLICIVGPTAIGKTSLGICLAKKLGADIISADSRQIYRGMSIGTATPTHEERTAVPHHFVDFLDPRELYSAGDFERDTLEFLEGYFTSRDVAIMVGGSGLYVKGVVDGFDSLPSDLKIRESLNARLKSEGLESLVFELKALDPDHAAKMDVQNPQRVIRALEVYLVSGKPMSTFHTKKNANRSFDVLQIGLMASREVIQERISKRTKIMLEAGWIEEVRALLPLSDCNSLRTVGYKELISHLNGQCSLQEAVERIAISTRQFAKRQMTWFKKDGRVVWFNYTESDSAVAYCERYLKEHES